MAADKQPISRHKTSSTRARQTGADTARAFDIIPPGKVRPSASSRPVILPSGPPVQDTTLRTDTGAPELQLTHKTPVFDVPEPALSKDTPASSADSPGSPDSPGSQGVLLADLVAKREKAAKVNDPLPDEPVLETELADTVKDPTKPDEIPHDVIADVPAAEPTPKAAAEESDDKPEATDVPDNLSAVLTQRENQAGDDTSGDTEPKEHSASLKQAMDDLQEHDGKPQYELYGGKPVIVVHKHHGTSVLAWVGWFLFSLVLTAVIIDLLLDSGLIVTDYIIPHTNFFK